MPKWMPLPIMQLAFKNCVICKMVGIVMLRPVPGGSAPRDRAEQALRRRSWQGPSEVRSGHCRRDHIET